MQLHSELLDLRSTTEDDLAFVLSAEQAELNRTYIGQWSKEQHAASLLDGDVRHLTIQEHTGDRVGYVIVTGLLDPNLSVSIKRIVIQAKGRGYGTTTLRLLTDWLFRETTVHRLWLDVKEHNGRAQHVYEGVGFTLEGTLRDCIKVGETFESLQIMSILRPEYMERGTHK